MYILHYYDIYFVSGVGTNNTIFNAIRTRKKQLCVLIVVLMVWQYPMWVPSHLAKIYTKDALWGDHSNTDQTLFFITTGCCQSNIMRKWSCILNRVIPLRPYSCRLKWHFCSFTLHSKLRWQFRKSIEINIHFTVKGYFVHHFFSLTKLQCLWREIKATGLCNRKNIIIASLFSNYFFS